MIISTTDYTQQVGGFRLSPLASRLYSPVANRHSLLPARQEIVFFPLTDPLLIWYITNINLCHF